MTESPLGPVKGGNQRTSLRNSEANKMSLFLISITARLSSAELAPHDCMLVFFSHIPNAGSSQKSQLTLPSFHEFFLSSFLSLTGAPASTRNKLSLLQPSADLRDADATKTGLHIFEITFPASYRLQNCLLRLPISIINPRVHFERKSANFYEFFF